ncbi:MAG: hypothetical protein QM572_04560, partial [Nocardioides sp.]|uniref:hypothetical protein n=1 Tax=Nocardioides sp. TaxID=35761 RepID=UPI0039E467C5
LPAARVRQRAALSLPLRAARRLVPSWHPAYLLGAPARSELRLYGLRATYPTAAAEAQLAWQPEVGLDAGLAEAAGRR